MKSLQAYDINFKSLKQGEHHYHFDIDAAFFEAFQNFPVQEADVSVDITFDKRRETLFLLTFDLKGTFGLECDRCLNPVEFPVEDQFTLYVKLDQEGNAAEKAEDDIVFLSLDAYKINVALNIYEFLILLKPMKIECASVGRKCNPKMVKILKDVSGEKGKHDKETHDPRWDKLKNLLNNSNLK